MSIAVSISVIHPCSRRAPTRASSRIDLPPDDGRLPHWSEVEPPPGRTHDQPRRARPAASVAATLADLVSWAADLAIALTHDCPEDRIAIEDVRSYALAWLAGKACPQIPIEDVLTSVAALLSGIDLDLGRARERDGRRGRDPGSTSVSG